MQTIEKLNKDIEKYTSYIFNKTLQKRPTKHLEKLKIELLKIKEFISLNIGNFLKVKKYIKKSFNFNYDDLKFTDIMPLDDFQEPKSKYISNSELRNNLFLNGLTFKEQLEERVIILKKRLTRLAYNIKILDDLKSMNIDKLLKNEINFINDIQTFCFNKLELSEENKLIKELKIDSKSNTVVPLVAGAMVLNSSKKVSTIEYLNKQYTFKSPKILKGYWVVKTCGDSRVCSVCESNSGKVIQKKDKNDNINLHYRCRCWLKFIIV